MNCLFQSIGQHLKELTCCLLPLDLVKMIYDYCPVEILVQEVNQADNEIGCSCYKMQKMDIEEKLDHLSVTLWSEFKSEWQSFGCLDSKETATLFIDEKLDLCLRYGHCDEIYGLRPAVLQSDSIVTLSLQITDFCLTENHIYIVSLIQQSCSDWTSVISRLDLNLNLDSKIFIHKVEQWHPTIYVEENWNLLFVGMGDSVQVLDLISQKMIAILKLSKQ